MKITQVSFGLTLTQTLPGHCNVKPSLSLTAEVEEGETAEGVQDKLRGEVESYLKEYVNQALEAEDKAAKYHDGLAYQIMRLGQSHWPDAL